MYKFHKKYNNYQNDDIIWSEIFKEIDELKKQGVTKFITNIALKYNINSNTLAKKYNARIKRQNTLNINIKSNNIQNINIDNINDNIDTININNIPLINEGTNVISLTTHDANIYKNEQNNEIDINKKNNKNMNENINEIKNDGCIIKEYRGIQNNFFTYEQEKEIFDDIKINYIEKNLYIDDYCLKKISINKWNKIHPDKLNAFKASNGWIYKFKKKWKLSTLKAKYTKISKYLTEDAIESYLNCCKYYSNIIDKKYIFNMDETFWRTIFANRYVIGLTGSENRPVTTNINPKSGNTAIFLISAIGKFYEPIIVLKGKTNRSLKKIDIIENNLIHKKYSKNGWINNHIMLFILNLICEITEKNESLLILDKYSVHVSDEIKNKAKQLNINLLYVPEGGTSKYQPLDVSINGIIKSIGRKIIKDIYLDDPNKYSPLITSIKALITAKQLIKTESIINSFKKACYF